VLCARLWNGQDPILKERLFGLTNGEGNHGEDVKEYYYYLTRRQTIPISKCFISTRKLPTHTSSCCMRIAAAVFRTTSSN
jgi:hypothetical protein